MEDYRKWQVWERAHRLTLEVYQAMRTFPKIDRLHQPASQQRVADGQQPIASSR